MEHQARPAARAHPVDEVDVWENRWGEWRVVYRR